MEEVAARRSEKRHRKQLVGWRLSDDEHAVLVRRAEAAELSVQDYLRRVALDGAPLQPSGVTRQKDIDRKLLAGVISVLNKARLSQNLNQLALAAHRDRHVDRDMLADAVEDLRTLKAALYSAMGLRYALKPSDRWDDPAEDGAS